MTHLGQLVELPGDFVGQHDVPVIRGLVVERWSPLMLVVVMVVLVLAGRGGSVPPAGGRPRHGDDRALEGVAPAKKSTEKGRLSKVKLLLFLFAIQGVPSGLRLGLG